MILFSALLVAAAPAPADTPPAAATGLLTAVASGDLAAAGATLAEDVAIMDSSGASPAASSLDAFAASVRGCAQGEPSWDVDGEDRMRAAVTVRWTCPSRPGSEALIWTAGPRVVWIQFGLPIPQ